MKKTSILLLPILLCAAPNKPSNITLSPTSNSVTVSWTDNSNDERGFKIFRDGEFIALVAPNKTSYVDRGLRANKNYRYEIRATDDQENLVNSISAKNNNDVLSMRIDGRFKSDAHAAFAIDADNNPNTGYTRGNIVGADYLVDGRTLFSYGGVKDGKKWNWDKISSDVVYSLTSTKATFEVPLNQINLSSAAKYIAEVSSGDWSKRTDYSVMNEISVGASNKMPLFIIGPSTTYIADEAEGEVHQDQSECSLDGWGEHLYKYAVDSNLVYNYALPGAGAGSFRLSPLESDEDERLYGPQRDHYWSKTKEKMQEHDRGFLLIQFGANDAWRLDNKFPTGRDYDGDGDIDWDDNDVRWALKYEDFSNNVKFYIDEAKAMNYTPILLTEPNGKKFENGVLVDTRTESQFIREMREIAQRENVTLLDLYSKTFKEYSDYGKADTDRIFDVCFFRSGNRDFNHFSPQGANIVAGWIRDLACEEPNSTLCKQFK